MTTPGTNSAENYSSYPRGKPNTVNVCTRTTVHKQYATTLEDMNRSGQLPPDYLGQLFWVSTGHSQAISPPNWPHAGATLSSVRATTLQSRNWSSILTCPPILTFPHNTSQCTTETLTLLQPMKCKAIPILYAGMTRPSFPANWSHNLTYNCEKTTPILSHLQYCV